MPKLTNEYKLAWKEKLGSLFVSAKMILFFSTVILSTVLLLFNVIHAEIWGKVMGYTIIVIAGFRGIVQIADVLTKNKEQNLPDSVREFRNSISSSNREINDVERKLDV